MGFRQPLVLDVGSSCGGDHDFGHGFFSGGGARVRGKECRLGASGGTEPNYFSVFVFYSVGGPGDGDFELLSRVRAASADSGILEQGHHPVYECGRVKIL